MIPLRDENPTRTFPFVTIVIIAVNVLVFLYELSLGEQLQEVVMRFGAIPYSIMHLRSLTPLMTLFTSLFFHGGFSHIIGNMLYLWVFGNNIEDVLGHLRFLAFYLVCGILATLSHIIISPESRLPLIGASGAISGILGAYLLLYPHAKILVLLPVLYFWRIVKLPAIWFLGFWILLQILNGTSSTVFLGASERGGVAWFAHIGGFLAGLVLLGIFLREKSRRL